MEPLFGTLRRADRSSLPAETRVRVLLRSRIASNNRRARHLPDMKRFQHFSLRHL
jgi:hypothetical protein